MIKNRMSRFGVGPVFAILSFGYGMVSVVVSRYFDPFFRIEVLPYGVLAVVGSILIVVGIPFLVVSEKTVMRAYHAKKLVTSGIFRCCRHPLYASWLFFLIPGIVCLSGSWIALTTPVFMYLVLRRLVRREEDCLQRAFGHAYREYQQQVPCIFPVGCFRRHL